ncbi:hypothetical protein FB567DRAFT_315159 [Paraphoma chrysanthemicola]|uniref:DUF7053 domain-containing protein n=1 Tax=Paraphoma chrysanthemicola TaxID=798071 RepID=A0A8K0RAD3_9PLEO|nr:hypothetical protein FB567DRAFT_315159 [Paraphoma chrysanthemicola]
MPKTATFTTITPLPTGITRKSVLEMYQDHLAMIDLNPLVVERFRCRPPSYAPSDEYYSTWYTIKDKVSYLPGGLATGSVSYHACFHDHSDGLQTHVYAPLGLDIRAKWSVGGSLAGEARPRCNKGVSVPRTGLYIREDVTMTCSTLLMGFVKRTFKDSHASLVEKLVERAHILESNFANERLQALRNVDPGERMAVGDIFIAPPPDYHPPGCLTPVCDSQPSPLPVYSTNAQPSPSPYHRYDRSLPPTPLYRIQTQPSPHYSPPAHSSHSRSYSDPIASPGFSSASTLVSEGDRPTTPPKDSDSDSMVMKFAFIDQPNPLPVSASAPEPNMYLLPATTYGGPPSFDREPARTQEHTITSHDGGFSTRRSKARPLSLYPGGHQSIPRAPTHTRNQSATTTSTAPRISYHPEERPISFTFPGETDDMEAARDAARLLSDIDDAIEQCFRVTKRSEDADERRGVFGAEKGFEVLLPSTTYDASVGARHGRKDSVVPWSAGGREKELPPVPVDGK